MKKINRRDFLSYTGSKQSAFVKSGSHVKDQILKKQSVTD